MILCYIQTFIYLKKNAGGEVAGSLTLGSLTF